MNTDITFDLFIVHRSEFCCTKYGLKINLEQARNFIITGCQAIHNCIKNYSNRCPTVADVDMMNTKG